MSIKVEQQLFESFKQFSELYRATVEKTGKQSYEFRPETLQTLHTGQMPTYVEKEYVDEIMIKMSEDEYNRFMQNWSMYIDLMYVTRHNPIIREEFEKVLIMVKLLR
jgi:chloramphenicol O-acetyltransferase